MSDAALASEILCEEELEQMTTEELLILYKQSGNEQIKWEIVLRYEELVKRAAMQIRGIYISFTQTEDIINEGLITLAKAIDKFDPDRGVKFETYVAKRIRGMVIDLARKQDWMPRNMRKRAKEIDEAMAELSNMLGRFPTGAEMAEFLQVPEEKYQKDVASIAMNNVLSLEALMDSRETERPHFEIATRDGSTVPETVMEEEELRQVLTEGIAKLRENEQIVLSLYYVDNLLLREIAQVMNVTEPRTSQLHVRAIKKLRKHVMEYYGLTDEKKEKKG